jgi:hypothetical protein
LLTQPEEQEGSGPAARHVDLRLQTNPASTRLQSRLIKTERDARTFVDEQGVNILYLDLGTLPWYESQSTQEATSLPFTGRPTG